MSTIKSSTEHLTLNADGSGKDIKFQANGVEVASISSTGNLTSTGIDDNATSTAITIDASENVGIGTTAPAENLDVRGSIQVGTDGTTAGLIRFMDSGSVTEEATISSDASGGLIFGGNSGAGELIFNTGSGTERMRIDSAGRVTMPYQPAAVAYSMPSPNNGTLVYSTKKFDNAGNMNLTNGRFTCPVAGVYSVSISGMYNSGRTNNGDVAIRVNNSLYVRAAYSNESKSQYVAITGVSLVKVAANDYITIFTEGDYHDNHAPVFSVHLVG